MASSLRTVALYLAVIQFFFSLTWIVYVVYLGDLLEGVGIGRDKLLWFILLDQLIRVLVVYSGVHKQVAGQVLIDFLPAISWAVASVLLYVTWYYYRRYEREKPVGEG